MRHRRVVLNAVLVVGAVLVAVLASGCGSQQPDARRALEGYLTAVQEGRHADAYALVSDFDKRTITEEAFRAWRSSADRVLTKQGFRIGSAVDRFRNFEYLGVRFRDAYGFDVEWTQELHAAGLEPTDYDQDRFKILVVEEDGSFRVALLLADLEARTEPYRAAP